MEQNPTDREGKENPKRFTGTLLEKRLKGDERRACRNEAKWFVIALTIVTVGMSAIAFGAYLGNLKYWLWAIVPVSLLMAILRYDKFCHERKAFQTLILAYIQREAGGNLGKKAETRISKFYQHNHDSPGEKMNMLERIIKIFRNEAKN